jgi:predicted  nucleic acid-binding Zn-ribbon protein
MVGTIQRGRKRPSLAISEDGDEESDYPSSASTGSKRARHARDASETPARSHGNQRSRPQTQNDDTNDPSAYVEDEFQAGSLVRVKLKNFVTYTAAEFHLGPSLNMVIGPNGTGKSTLVCAICLGLGWGSEHLGRAKDLGAFVKHGAAEAVIEIELAAGPGNGPNPIVQRTIRKEDNKSFFLLNGKRATRDAVTTMAREFSIQIDNLCQFLPQDRVVEFAKMTDVDRLRETQRAAAPPHMVEWHDQLKSLRAEERGLETKQKNEQMHLEKLDKQQNATRGDVQRFHQREELLRKSKCLQKVKPIIEIRIRKDQIKKIKEDTQTANRELAQLQADVEPVKQAQEEMQQYQNQIEQVRNLRRNRVESLKVQADKLVVKIDQEKQKALGFTSQITAELQSKKKRDGDITRFKNDIRALERQHQEGPVQYDAASYAERIAELRSQISSNSNLHVDKKATREDLRSRIHGINAENKMIQEQRQQLDTQSGKQASLLQKASRDTAQAWSWIQKNRNTLSLKGHVHGPPILECSIENATYADAVESQLRRGDVLAITCTNSEDQKLLSSRLLSKPENGGLGLHDVHLRTSPKHISSYQAPVARADLPRYGFQSYILDHIRGPDEVLAMLCDNVRLHQIASTTTPISDQQHAAVSNSPIRTWVSGRDTFKVTTRREYNASSTSVTPLRRAQWFTNQPADTDEKQELDERIQRLRDTAAEVKSNHDMVNQELKELEQLHTELVQKRVRACYDTRISTTDILLG